MIREIGLELGVQLIARGCPLPVVNGPEPSETVTWGRERIVIEHDEGGGDAFGPAVSQSKNPKIRRTRSAAYKLTIYAQARGAGSAVFEHRRRAEHVLDSVLIAMDYVAAGLAGGRKNRWAPKAGKFFAPKDLTGAEVPGGAAYELKFTFDRGVAVRTWAGAARPEATLGASSMRSTTKVSQNGGTDSTTTVPATAETSCGA